GHPEDPPQPNVELPTFVKKLEEFVRKIESRNMKPMLITPLPLHAEKFFNWVSQDLDKAAILKAVGEVQNIYGWQERYAIAVRSVAAKTNTPLLDLRDTFLANKDYPSLICRDGMHLLDDGYRYIADYLLRRIQLTPECI
ncbi:MAG: hypothetical protein ABIG45_09410, partial [Bacillota bacterium]